MSSHYRKSMTVLSKLYVDYQVEQTLISLSSFLSSSPKAYMNQVARELLFGRSSHPKISHQMNEDATDWKENHKSTLEHDCFVPLFESVDFFLQPEFSK